MKVKNIIRWILAIIVYFLLSYFRVGDRDLREAVMSTIILIATLAVIEVIACLLPKKKWRLGGVIASGPLNFINYITTKCLETLSK